LVIPRILNYNGSKLEEANSPVILTLESDSLEQAKLEMPAAFSQDRGFGTVKRAGKSISIYPSSGISF